MSDKKISKNRKKISCEMCLSILKTRLTKFEGNLERILGTIDKAIGKCNSNTEEVEKVEKKCAKCLEVVQEEDAERIKTWLEVTQEEEGEMIEDLLGVAFVYCQPSVNSQLFMDFVSSLRHSVEGGDDTIRANPPNPYNPCFYYGLKQEHGFDGLFGFSLMGYGNSKKTDF